MVDQELTFVRTFSKLGGETNEKQTKKTSVWGYDNGRKRLELLASRFVCHTIRKSIGHEGLKLSRTHS